MKKYLLKAVHIKRILSIVIACIIVTVTVSAQSTVEKETMVYSVRDTTQLHLDKYVDNSVAVSMITFQCSSRPARYVPIFKGTRLRRLVIGDTQLKL